jgi:hypothetical protein
MPAQRTTFSAARAWLAAALTILLVLGLVACGYLVYRLNHINDEPLNPLSGAPVEPSDTERKQATAVAEQFALRMDNVDGTDFDGYIKGINELLTTKAKTENQKTFDAMKQSYSAAKVKGTGKVLVSGVSELDDDSATVLVAHDASVKTTQGNIEHHYRWTVNLVKVNGEWRVDDFNPVN